MKHFGADLTRLVACIAVVILHVCAPYVLRFGQVAPLIWHVTNLLDSATRWCVPVFIMLSGALLLGRAGYDPAGFYRRRLDRLGPAVLFWIPFYLILWTQIIGPWPDAAAIGSSLWHGGPWFHTYYLSVIAGLYVVAPLLSLFVNRYSRGTIWIAAILTLLAATVETTFIRLPFTVLTGFLHYIGYFLLGFLLKDARPRRGIYAPIFVVAACATAGGSAYLVSTLGLSSPWGLYPYGFFTPNVIAMAVTVFLLTYPAGAWNAGAVVSWLASLTFGIYLAHPAIMGVYSFLVAPKVPDFYNSWAHLIATLAVGLGGAALVSAIFGRVPGLRRVV